MGSSIYDVAFRYQSHRNGVNRIFSRVIGSYFAKETLYIFFGESYIDAYLTRFAGNIQGNLKIVALQVLFLCQ